MERRQFTREFKLKAVRLIKDRGVSYVRRHGICACIRRSCAIG
jgi:transposase-like protein